MKRDIYRLGGPTHERWIVDLESARKIIEQHDALVTDPEDGWVGVDPAKLEGLRVGGLEFADYYRSLVAVGFHYGWAA